MGFRRIAQECWGGRASAAMHALNARHPWDHNAAFHPWILTRLPQSRRLAVDVGCGRGDLLAALAPFFEHVHGTDQDRAMRAVSHARCAGLANVSIDDADLDGLPDGADLITMVAVLHHLDIEPALATIRERLAPGGRFLCVGLAPPSSVADHAWDVASMLTNPLIGFVRHPWPAVESAPQPPIPVAQPTVELAELGRLCDQAMPGARIRRHLGFRHTVEWTAPHSG